MTPLAPAWLAFDGGTADIGHDGSGFAFDNGLPRHAVRLRPYALANRLVTHGEWLAFMDNGGYDDTRAHPRQLPQFFPERRTLSIQRRAPGP